MKKEYSNYCPLFSGWTSKKRLAAPFCVPRGSQISGSATQMDLVIDCHLLQLIIISSQSTENNRVYSVCSHKMHHQMSSHHRMLNTYWKCYDASICACPRERILNTLSLNLLVSYHRESSNCCFALSICGPVCPSKMFPSDSKNSSTI